MTAQRISIITPSFNQGEFLEETLRTVLNQRYANLEYIVIDGGSSDGSVDIIRKFENQLAYWISEPDRGQVHAINKGLERATGDIIGYINSDDVYLPGAFTAVARYFSEHPDCRWLCGDTIMFGGEFHHTELICTVVPRSAAHCLCWAYKAPQPGMFWKRDLLLSGFDEKWRYCFDHELYVRLLLDGHKCQHLSLPLAGYRLHASSKTVAEGRGFDKEFDTIALTYQSKLNRTGRRWLSGTQWLRESYSASQGGNTLDSFAYLLHAAAVYPECLRRRPFWGCLRQALATTLKGRST